MVEYDAHEFNRLSKVDNPKVNLSQMQKNHLAKELSEILINLSSHSGSRIHKCMLVDPNSFVFDTKTGWNDAKIDLFYLTVVSDMRVTEAIADGKSSFMPSLTNKESQSKASQRVGFNLKDDGTESQFSIISTSS